jgi:hypothetical protein
MHSTCHIHSVTSRVTKRRNVLQISGNVIENYWNQHTVRPDTFRGHPGSLHKARLCDFDCDIAGQYLSRNALCFALCTCRYWSSRIPPINDSSRESSTSCQPVRFMAIAGCYSDWHVDRSRLLAFKSSKVVSRYWLRPPVRRRSSQQ